MRSIEQEKTRLTQIKNILEQLKKTTSINEISKITGISSSTIQRRLNDNEFINRFLEENNINTPFEDYQSQIKNWLKQAKTEGNKKGGITSQQRHSYDKDEFGKFLGSGPKGK